MRRAHHVALSALAAVLAAASTDPPPPSVSGFSPPVAGVFYGGGDLGPVLQVADAAACGAACAALGSACVAFNTCANGSLVRCGPQTWSRTLSPVANAGCAAYVRERPRNDSLVAQAVPWLLAAPAAGSVSIPAGAAGGLLRSMFEGNLVYLLQYSVDDMLFPFRQRAGLPNPGQCFGWDCPVNWIEGSTAALFLMGAGNHLRWEEHAQLRAMMNAVVSGIKECAQPNGFIMGFNESELVTDEHPDYTLSWTTHGLLAAHAAGHPDALQLARGMVSLFNNHSLLPLFLPPDGGDEPFAAPAVFPPPFPQWDNVTNQGESPLHGHSIYLIYQGLIHQTQMALSEAGTQADVDLVAQLYEEGWWLQQLAAGDPGAIWHRQWWSHNYELTAVEAYLDMFVLTGAALYRDAVMGAWRMWRESFLHLGGSVAVNEVEYYYPGSRYLTAEFIEGGWHSRAARRGVEPLPAAPERAHGRGHAHRHGHSHSHSHSHDAHGHTPHGAGDDVGSHPTGEFCGASFWQRINQRLHRLEPENETFVLEIEREVFNEAPAHQGALMPRPILAGGEFAVAIGGDGRVWWVKNGSGVKNYLQVCEPCRGTTIDGCASVVQEPKAFIDGLVEGPFFTCDMLPPDPAGGVISSGIRYFSNLNGVKQAPYNIGTCCEGQGTRMYSSLHEFIFSVPADAATAPLALYVDLYAAAAVTLAGGVTVEVATRFPFDSTVAVTVTCGQAGGADLDLAIRIPAWAAAPGGGVQVTVGGAAWPALGAPGSYLHVSRRWAAGATAVAFALPMALQAHLYTGDTQRPPFSRYGFTFGPILLAAVGAFNASVDAVALPGVDPTAPQDWLIAQGNLTFGVAGVAGVTFVPYGAIYGETFSVYPVFLAAPLPPAVGAVSVN